MVTGVIPQRVFVFFVALVIFKACLTVAYGYPNYFPPDFTDGFLFGRESYFVGGYQWAFYAHIVSGPLSLLLGLFLLNDSIRRRLPVLHRSTGRIQVANILGILVPSGFWMAWYTQAGDVAAWGFATLAIATAISTVMGFVMALRRRFAEHRQWMMRSYVLLCSAVVIRIMGGLQLVFGAHQESFDQLSAWACWLLPLAIYEAITHHKSSQFDRAQRSTRSVDCNPV
jgi:hypothetical protein